VLTPAGRAAATLNPRPRSFTEILYAYASCMANDGLMLGGLDTNNVFYNMTTMLAMLAGRYGLAALALITAGHFAAQRRSAGNGALAADTPTFGVLLLGTILLTAAVSFVPALAMGSLAEWLQR
jgi:K+-transporting ATPase ATPase A chain